MPVYEYTCEACKSRFEKLVKSMSSSPHISCPQCGSNRTSRSLSVFAVGGETQKASTSAPGMCGRCGGPGPCAN